MENSKQIAKYLLQIKAVELEPQKTFTWASGLISPIYCDNRKTLSYSEIRDEVKKSFVNLIKNKFSNVEAISGVATGGIALGVLVAQELNLPFSYIRAASKKHGKENLIEGVISKNQKIVVIEDLISTGGSSLKAVDALREEGCDVLGLCAIFTYNFQTAIDNFKNKNCEFYTLTNFNDLINIALETNYINKSDIELLNNWKSDPENWKK